MGKSWNLALISGIITVLWLAFSLFHMEYMDSPDLDEGPVIRLLYLPLFFLFGVWFSAGTGYATVAGIVVFLMLWLTVFLLIAGFWNLVEEIIKPKLPG